MNCRKILLWLGAAMLLGLGALALCFFNAGHFLIVPTQQPAKADLIFALGGDDGGRAHGALDLYRRGLAPRILLGGEGKHSKTRQTYLSWRARHLVDAGVPENALLYDPHSSSSWEEAVNTLELMRSMKLDRVLVVSDPPHTRRLSMVWDKVFAGSGKEYTLVAADMDDWDPADWWSDSPSAQYVFREYIKLVYYLVKY